MGTSRTNFILPAAVAAGAVTILAASLAPAEEVDARYTARSDYKPHRADQGPNEIDVSGFPEEIRKLYPEYVQRCGACHPLARAINTDKPNSAWVHYIKRMSQRPESGISPVSGRRLYKFIKYFQAYRDLKKRKKEKTVE